MLLQITMAIAREVASVTRLGVEVAIVVGGGNIFRGASWAGCSGLDRSSADYIGYDVQFSNVFHN
jgi:uridylate kinase